MASHPGPTNPNWRGGKSVIACEQCGKEFHAFPSQRRRFCSAACKNTRQSDTFSGTGHPRWKDKSHTCTQCGKVFQRIRTTKDLKGCGVFCSSRCWYDWNSQNLVGPQCPRWRGGKERYYGPNWNHQAEAARKRDNNSCRICGSKRPPRGKRSLDVHHVRPFKSFAYVVGENDHYLAANDLTNLVTLCRVCHKKVEAGRLAVQPFLL